MERERSAASAGKVRHRTSSSVTADADEQDAT